MFEWLRNLTLKAQSVVSRGVVLFEGQTLQFPQWDMTAQIKEGYETNSVVYACVNLIATTAAGINWCLKKKSGTQLQEVEDHPLLDLIKRPNPMMGQSGFIQDVFNYWLITGNGFIWKVAIGQEVKELWSLRSDRIAIQPGNKVGLIQHYEYRVNGVSQRLEADQVCHLKLFSGSQSEWFGLSPVQVGALLVDTDNKSVNWNRSLLGNRGRPDAVFSFKQTLLDDQRENFKQRLSETYGGGDNSGRPLVIEGSDFTYQQTSSTPTELDFVGSTSMTNRRICQLYNVAPELIGDPQNKTYSNQAEARLALVEQVVFPKLDYLRDQLNNWLVPQYGEGLALDYDRDSVDVIAAKRQMVYQSLSVADFLTVNEKREAAGYDKIEDPDADVPDRLLGTRALTDMGTDIPDEDPPPEPEAKPDPEENKKAWNLRTYEEKELYWKSFDSKRRAIEANAQKLVKKRFAQERASVLATIKTHATDGMMESSVKNVVKAKSRAMGATLATIYRVAGSTFFRDTLAKLPATGKSLERKDVAVALQGLTAYLNVQAGKKAEKLATVTTDKLADLLRKMILGGKTTEEVVDAVTDLYSTEFEQTRSQRIAETEVGQAANAGVVYAGKSLDRPILKSWISMGDERVRDPSRGSEFSHLDENIKEVGIDDLFEVSGEKLEFPGDSSHGASPGNVINCRCAASLGE